MRLTTIRLCRLTTLLLVTVVLSERVALAIPTPDSASAKQQIAARGVGKGIKVHEADGATLREKIVALNEDSFRMQVGSKAPLEIAYSNIRAVDGPGFSNGSKIGIVVGLATVTVVAIVIGVAASHAPGLHF